MRPPGSGRLAAFSGAPIVPVRLIETLGEVDGAVAGSSMMCEPWRMAQQV
jgi:hypothetical protein